MNGKMTEKTDKLPWKLKIILILFIAANVISFTRGFQNNELFYFGKFALIGAVFFLAALFVANKGRIEIAEGVRGIYLFFCAWLFFMLVSLFNGPNPVSGVLVIGSYFLLFVIAFILFPNCIGQNNAYLEMKKVFLWATLVSLFGIVLYGFQDPNSWYIVGDRVRYQSFFANPNFLGLFAFLGAMISLEIFAIIRSKKYLFFALPCLYLIYLSGSRAALLSIVVFCAVMFSLMVYSMIKRGREKNALKMFVFYFSLFAVSAGFYLVLSHWSDFYDPMQAINQIFSFRPYYWIQELADLDVRGWLFGRGVGTEGLGAVRFDNFYFDTLIQAGLFGLVFMAAFLFSVLKRLFGFLNKKSGYWRRTGAASLAMFVAICAYSFFESFLFSLGNVVSIYLWINVGSSVNKIDRGDSV